MLRYYTDYLTGTLAKYQETSDGAQPIIDSHKGAQYTNAGIESQAHSYKSKQ